MALVGQDASSDWNAIHKPGLIEKVGLVSGAKKVGKFDGPAAGGGGGGSSEPPFWNLSPIPEGTPPITGIAFIDEGIIGSVFWLLVNLANNLGRTYLNTGNIRFKSERMGTIRSGLFLVFFVIAHSMDNQVTHLGRVQYNAMTYMMADRIQGECTYGFAWFDTYIGMAVLLHVTVALKRSWEINMAYTVGSGKWKWLLSGLAILTFLIQHLCDFRFAANIDPDSVKIIHAKLPPNFLVRFAMEPPFVFMCADDNDPNAWVVTTRDVYTVEAEVFSNPIKVLQYVCFVSAVGIHLFWAWPKVVTSEGLAIPKGHQNNVKLLGWAMAVICCLLYVSVPISFYLGIMPSATGPSSEVCGTLSNGFR